MERKCKGREYGVWLFCSAIHKKTVWTLNVWLCCFFRFFTLLGFKFDIKQKLLIFYRMLLRVGAVSSEQKKLQRRGDS